MTNLPTDKPPTDRPRWHDDPVEIDRTLEGESLEFLADESPTDGPSEFLTEGRMEPRVRAERLAEAEANPALAARLAARRRFLAGLSDAGSHYRAGLATAAPVGLEGRVRSSLASPRRSILRWAVAAAAVLLLGLGVSLFSERRGSHAEAMPNAVIHAAEAARSAATGPRGCDTPQAGSPLRFPPVRNGSLQIWACVEKDGSTIAKLQRPEELPAVGYAAVPAPGVEPGPTVGRTDLGDTVVFDIAYGRKVHYLAVRKPWLERQRMLTPGRQSCRACHHLSRRGQTNPHRIIDRSWRLSAH